MIHPTAIVHPSAKIDRTAEIGPYSLVGENVRIGARTKLLAHVVVNGYTAIGEDTTIYPFASIGAALSRDHGISAGDRVALARSENNLGLILMARGDLAAARQHLDRSIELGEEADLQRGRSRMLLSLCELCLQEDNVDRAGEFAREALAVAGRLHEGQNVAEAHMWLGRIADKLGDPEGADRARRPVQRMRQRPGVGRQPGEHPDKADRLSRKHGQHLTLEPAVAERHPRQMFDVDRAVIGSKRRRRHPVNPFQMKRHGDDPSGSSPPNRSRQRGAQPITEMVNGTYLPQVCLVFGEELPQLVRPNENFKNL